VQDLIANPKFWPVLDISLFVILLNVPLGRLRAHAKRYSWRNFGCILAPVPMVVFIRMMAGLSIKFAPLFIIVAIAGQRLGIWTVRASEK
jgi:hypothetical protein